MTRYFLDTGPLLGVTFLHDLWRDESEQLFATDNTLYTSDAVLYEYCNYDGSNDLETADIDLESEDGRFGQILSKVRLAQRSLDIKLRSYDDDELDLKTLVDEFIEETGLDEEIEPEELLDKRIKPNVGEYLANKIGRRDVTKEVAREVMDDLCDEIETAARETQEMIDQRVKRAPQREDDWSNKKRRLHFVDDRIDKEILCDAANMYEMNRIRRVVTTDNNHMYSNRERINTILGLVIVFIKDEFSETTLPSSSETE
ncbi:hypothetical protein ACFPM1_12325 [Halorubrum rubrum]|uniref:DUF4935 domain-containing protein n=1 Tax=Halorubrum rubrum TaxID=1126240 RepID=A0ABD5R4J1_9EURY|nr:hypothetical protein [Halorubrum rubrum]